MEKYLDDLFKILVLFVFSGFFFCIGKNYGSKENTGGLIKIKRDTIYRVDTITKIEPIEKIRYKDKLVYIPITNIDTTIIHDTTFIALQSEKVIYEDSTYRAIVSGIYPKLEEISVFPKTIYITEQKENIVKKKFNLNATIGPGILYNGKVSCGIGCVVGIGYSF